MAEVRVQFDDAVSVAVSAALRYGMPEAAIGNTLEHFVDDIKRRAEMARERRNYATSGLHRSGNIV